MVPKWFIWFFLIVCSTIGSYIPLLWGGEFFSFSSLILSTVGGLFGIWLAIRIGKAL